ncbi:uncharacterized protein LOC109838254 [Asparagus officinalis]|uniref:uncharacterized protein LOC109838254 n=1 Tax=Asparagus officinalis TaxID=4686 RepID=UPI00098E1F33|nr:uncharacterized protein LOC109838254 [Asparagus officinalis]
MTEPNNSLNLMAGKQAMAENEDPREQLFVLKLQVKTSLIDIIVDLGSQKNLISETLVRKLGLKTVKHPKPYPLGWIQKEAGLSVINQCTFRFVLHESYIDDVTCDIVPLDVCQVILGNPYLWNRYAVYDRWAQKYRFIKDGEQFIFCLVSLPQKTSLATMTQVKRLVNASKKFVLLFIRPYEEQLSRMYLTTLSKLQEGDLNRLKAKYEDLFSEITGLPPRRGVEHEIMLTDESSLSNIGLYLTSVQESEEIKRQVQELLQTGVIMPKDFVIVYLDDNLVCSKTWEEDLIHVEKVFEVLQNGQLKLNGKKCEFGKDELVYLGFIMEKGQRRIDPSKVAMITKWPTPRIMTEVRSFIGVCQYLRNFIRHFLTYAAPLHGLTKANVQFVWGRAHEEDFQLLKKKILEAPVLVLPNLQRTFEVETDASSYAMGVVLIQDGKLVEYHSDMFTSAIQNYPTYDKEFYALYQAIKHWRVYLLGKEMVVHSDHKPLEFLHAQMKLQ